MQSTSCEMPGWVSHKLESRMPGEITTISDDTILIAVSGEKLKEPLDEGEKRRVKSWLATQHYKL